MAARIAGVSKGIKKKLAALQGLQDFVPIDTGPASFFADLYAMADAIRAGRPFSTIDRPKPAEAEPDAEPARPASQWAALRAATTRRPGNSEPRPGDKMIAQLEQLRSRVDPADLAERERATVRAIKRDEARRQRRMERKRQAAA
jgi:hypothetical protein